MRTRSLRDPEVINSLQCRKAAHWNILEYCRHIGVEKQSDRQPYWVARIRKRGGGYLQSRIGPVEGFSPSGLSYDEAILGARQWFAKMEPVAAHAFPVGISQNLRYVRRADVFTIGNALEDYIEWKRIAATQKTFCVLVSLINWHIIPRLGNLPVDQLTAARMTEFCREVLETPPKHGNRPMAAHVALDDLEPDAIRRRKGTLNTLIGILRLAVRMAWENGHTDSERAWRCIRRVPNQEVPRQLFLTRAECRALIASCRPDLANLVRGALFTGCRIAELSELRVRDVGRDIFGILITTTKSRRPRYVYLPTEGMRFFMGLCQDREGDQRVFVTDSGKAWDGRHKHLFRAAVANAGLPEGFVFHGLRHTYASQLVQAGTPLAIVARQLGHANTDTVSRTYGHLSCESIERELQCRFAWLEDMYAADDPHLNELRRSLQNPPKLVPRSSWPNSNFNQTDARTIKFLRDN